MCIDERVHKTFRHEIDINSPTFHLKIFTVEFIRGLFLFHQFWVKFTLHALCTTFICHRYLEFFILTFQGTCGWIKVRKIPASLIFK